MSIPSLSARGKIVAKSRNLHQDLFSRNPPQIECVFSTPLRILVPILMHMRLEIAPHDRPSSFPGMAAIQDLLRGAVIVPVICPVIKARMGMHPHRGLC